MKKFFVQNKISLRLSWLKKNLNHTDQVRKLPGFPVDWGNMLLYPSLGGLNATMTDDDNPVVLKVAMPFLYQAFCNK
jgi:hypothetical protein